MWMSLGLSLAEYQWFEISSNRKPIQILDETTGTGFERVRWFPD